MNYLVKYKLFEPLVTSIVDEYIKDCKWDINNSIGNCAFFAKDFYEWCKLNKIECKLVYLKQDNEFNTKEEIEDHIIPVIDDFLIDFVYTSQGVSKRVREKSKEALQRQSKPEITLIKDINNKYSKWGYNTIEEVSYEDAFTGDDRKCWTIDYPKLLTEAIKVPIEIGDTILGGRFKNKKMIVKKIGKNKKGDITVNDKTLLKFRIIKESFKEEVDIYLAHLIDDGFIIKTEDYLSTDKSYTIRVWLPFNDTDRKYSFENSKDFKWSDVEDEIIRTVGYLSENFEIEYLYTISSQSTDGLGFKRTQWSVDDLIEGRINPGLIKCFLISVSVNNSIK